MRALRSPSDNPEGRLLWTLREQHSHQRGLRGVLVLTGTQWSPKTHSRWQGCHQLGRWAGASCGYTEGNPKLQRDPSLSLLSGALWLGSQAAARPGQQCGGPRQVGVRHKSLRLAGPEAWGKGSNCQAGSDPALNLETEKVSPVQSPSVPRD